MRIWYLRTLAAFLAVVLVTPSVRSAPPEFPSTTDEKLNRILDQLADLNVRLDQIRGNQLSQRIDIDRLQAEVDRLKEEMRRLSTTSTSIAASINPNAPVSPASPLVTGNIVVENLYSSPATVTINNTPYRVMPFARMSVPATVGRFTYTVSTDDFGLVQPPTDRFLTPGRDFPITIHP